MKSEMNRVAVLHTSSPVLFMFTNSMTTYIPGCGQQKRELRGFVGKLE